MYIKLLTSGWTYAVIMALLFGFQLLRNAKLESARAQDQRDAALALSDAVSAARKEEQGKAQQYINAVDKLTKDNEVINAEKDSILADLRNANLRLRRRFSCPAASVSGSSGAATGSDGAPQSGLLREDAEFLVRLAAEADQRVSQLTACQAVLREQQ
jgi:Tfp pilus assembly protein PilX